MESLLRAKHFPRIHPQFLQRVNIRLFESRKGDVDHVPRVSHSAMSTRLQYSLSLSLRFVAVPLKALTAFL